MGSVRENEKRSRKQDALLLRVQEYEQICFGGGTGHTEFTHASMNAAYSPRTNCRSSNAECFGGVSALYTVFNELLSVYGN